MLYTAATIVLILRAIPASASPVLEESPLAPLHAPSDPQTTLPESYIVVLKEDVNVAAHVSFIGGLDGIAEDTQEFTHVYDGSLKGYAGRFSNSTIGKLRTLPEVHYVEHDQIVSISEVDKFAPWVRHRYSVRDFISHAATYSRDSLAFLIGASWVWATFARYVSSKLIDIPINSHICTVHL